MPKASASVDLTESCPHLHSQGAAANFPVRTLNALGMKQKSQSKCLQEHLDQNSSGDVTITKEKHLYYQHPFHSDTKLHC